MGYEDSIRHQLSFLYGEGSDLIWLDIDNIIGDFRLRNPGLQSGKFNLTEKDAVLITYGDQFQNGDHSHLQMLLNFMKQYVGEAVNWIHLLPFFPYSSDDGFSVIDYRKVDSELGNWDDIQQLSREYSLMVDAVINHISKESSWFKGFQSGITPYREYFISIDPTTDLSSVFRPRALPLITPVETDQGMKYVWTTFSEDQIDLDYSNSQVLIEIIKLLLFYVEKGARLIRLDAVGYLWKAEGTSCLNLPQAHSIVKLFRAILNLAAPGTGLITETNVPHEENIRYFGDPEGGESSQGVSPAGDEAHMVYQFSLAPLILHTFLSEDSRILNQWVRTLAVPFRNTAFFNFIASHDGIGVMPAKGLLSESEIQALVDHTLLQGGEVSYKTNSDGSKSVYELNITLFDALSHSSGENQTQDIRRYIASQVIMLSLAGVPGIYVHSLFGSHNCLSCKAQTGRARSINREKFVLEELITKLNHPGARELVIFEDYKRLLLIRQSQTAFHPAAHQQVIVQGQQLFGLLRVNPNTQSRIICMVNVSSNSQAIEIDLKSLDLADHRTFHDLLSDQDFTSHNQQLNLDLDGFQCLWLSAR